MTRRIGTGAPVLLLALSPLVQAQGGAAMFSDRNAWAAAAACSLTKIDFDSFADGTKVTTELDPLTIALVSGSSPLIGGPTTQHVTAASSLPFPMFVAGLEPSPPNFLSNALGPPVWATGEITIDFVAETTAVGAFVCDSGPVGAMFIDVFDESGALVDTVTSAGPLSLPGSFLGLVSPTPFTRARFRAEHESDSWGIDDLEYCTPIACETQTALGVTVDPLGLNAPQSLAPEPPTSLPFLGNADFRIGVDDPGDACDLTPGLFTLLAVDFAPGAFVFDRLGCLPDQPGEVMLGFTFQAMFTSPQPWPGPGTPAVHPLPIPALEVLCGAQVFVQGFWIDLVGPSRPAILTQRLDLTLGSP